MKRQERWAYQTREAIRRAKKRVFSLSLFGRNREEREPMCPEQGKREDERTMRRRRRERSL